MVISSFVIIRPSDTSDQGSPAEDPRKIDSTWHIPPGWKKRELELSQLTRVMYAVWEKMNAEDDFSTDCKCRGKFQVSAIRLLVPNWNFD